MFNRYNKKKFDNMTMYIIWQINKKKKSLHEKNNFAERSEMLADIDQESNFIELYNYMEYSKRLLECQNFLQHCYL